MRITELLKKESIALHVSVDSKEAAIDYLVDLHDKAGNLLDREGYKAGILKREEEGSTAIGEGIAIPHSKNAAVKKAALAAMTVSDGVDYEALDGQPSNLFFMIAAPEDGADVHLEVLSRLSILLMDEQFRKDLLAAKDIDAFLKVIDEMEAKKFPEETANETADSEKNCETKNTSNSKDATYKVLAVTACPTGIAHTYMAAEALEKQGELMGYPCKAETNGSTGAKNVLTKEEIEACDGIIVAADKNEQLKFYMVANYLMYKNGEFDDYDRYNKEMEANLADVLAQVEKDSDEWAYEYAKNKVAFWKEHKDLPHYFIGSGNQYGATYSYAMCYWEEQMWIRTKSISCQEFFHGMQEIIVEDTPVTLFMGEDEQRPLAERVAKFLPRVNANYTIIDTKEHELKGISPEFRGTISHLVMHGVNNRVDAYMELFLRHPLSIRRYYRQFDY